MDRSVLAEAPPTPNIFGIGRMSSSLLKANFSKKASNPKPSTSTTPLPPPAASSETSYNQKLEDALAVESLVRQITEWDTNYNE